MVKHGVLGEIVIEQHTKLFTWFKMVIVGLGVTLSFLCSNGGQGFKLRKHSLCLQDSFVYI